MGAAAVGTGVPVAKAYSWPKPPPVSMRRDPKSLGDRGRGGDVASRRHAAASVCTAPPWCYSAGAGHTSAGAGGMKARAQRVAEI